MFFAVDGWTIATKEHVTLSKEGQKQFALDSQHKREHEEILIATAELDTNKVAPTLNGEWITYEEVIQAIAEDKDQIHDEMRQELEQSEVQEGDFIPAQKPNNNQMLGRTTMTVCHRDTKMDLPKSRRPSMT